MLDRYRILRDLLRNDCANNVFWSLMNSVKKYLLKGKENISDASLLKCVENTFSWRSSQCSYLGKCIPRSLFYLLRRNGKWNWAWYLLEPDCHSGKCNHHYQLPTKLDTLANFSFHFSKPDAITSHHFSVERVSFNRG